MPIETKILHQLHIDRIKFNVLKKSLVIIALNGNHEGIPQMNSQYGKASGQDTGATAVHAQHHDQVLR